MRLYGLAAAFVLAVACHALPSAVPLADTGGTAGPAAGARDRRSVSSGEESAGSGSVEEVAVTAAAPPAESGALGDAGVADAANEAGADATAAPQWPGEYYGSDRFVRRFESRPEDVQVDDKAHTRVEQPSSSSLLISVVNSMTGEVICALKASVNGAEATLESGQSCFADEDLEAEVTSGHAKIAGDLLTLDFEGKLEGEESDENAKDSYHFEGRRR